MTLFLPFVGWNLAISPFFKDNPVEIFSGKQIETNEQLYMKTYFTGC